MIYNSPNGYRCKCEIIGPRHNRVRGGQTLTDGDRTKAGTEGQRKGNIYVNSKDKRKYRINQCKYILNDVHACVKEGMRGNKETVMTSVVNRLLMG